MHNFDTARVFRVFGGPAGLLKEVDRYEPGHGLKYSQVAMWQNRRIPTKWMGVVLYTIEQTGHECSEFLVDDDELGLMPLPPSRRPLNARSRG